MKRIPKSEVKPGKGNQNLHSEDTESTRHSQQGTADRRVLRSRYLAVKNLISGIYFNLFSFFFKFFYLRRF